MNAKPIMLDLFCCEGGAAKGYHDVGFEVFGVDKDPQPRYPFWFHQGDAISVLRKLCLGHMIEFNHPDGRTRRLGWYDFDAIHASPPCQAHTRAQKLQGNDHPDLIELTRPLLDEFARPYVIENVPGAPLHDPVELCGAMFGLETYRHRLFETSWELNAPVHPKPLARTTKMGRPPQPGEFMHVVGNFSGVGRGRRVMGMPWASRDGLREAIPPAYTEHIGRQLLAHLEGEQR